MSYFSKMLCLAATVSILATQLQAQDVENTPGSKKNSKEIVIRKKTDKDTRVTIEINGDEVKVNGKPLSDFNDKDIEINLENINADVKVRGYATARSPFRSTLDFTTPVTVTGYGTNKAMLGVVAEKADDGARVNSVTQGSAAEKAGVRVGDVIT
ncbi:MAG: hypothetical protein ABI151_12080, partial [Chitinophagaceae bacterium]